MKKWLQNLSSAGIAFVLAVTLNGKAYADAEGQTPPVEAPVQIEQPAAEPVQQSISVVVSVETAEASAPAAQTATDAAPGTPEVPAAASSAAEIPAAEALAAETPGVGTPLAEAPVGETLVGETLVAETSAAGKAPAAGPEISVAVSEDAPPAPGTETPAAEDTISVQKAVPGTPAVEEKPDQTVSETPVQDEPQLLPKDASADGSAAVSNLRMSMAATPGMRGMTLSTESSGEESDQKGTGSGENSADPENASGDEQGTSQITVAGTSFTPDASVTIRTGWTEGTEGAAGSGWAYDGADGSITMVSYDGSAVGISSVNSDVTIKAAGINRLSSLSVDGNINLIGTGILLVDQIEMAADCQFNIQPTKAIYGEEYPGGVAVFLKQTDENGDSYYLLMNGSSAAAILDEEYVLPAGVTLVVPNGSTLVMQSVAVGNYTSPEGEQSVYYSTINENDVVEQLPGYKEQGDSYSFTGNVSFTNSSSPKLTISEQAKLVIQEQAALVMNAITKLHGGSREPLIEVSGTLELEGTSSDGFITVNSSGDVTGGGSFSCARITVNGGRTDPVTTLNVADGTWITLGGDRADLGALTASGSISLTYAGEASVGTLNVTENSVLDCYAYSRSSYYGNQKELSILNGISGGGSISLHSGVYVLGENCEISDNTSIGANGTAAEILDYYLDENGKANLTSNETPRVETREASQNGNGSSTSTVVIPCIVTAVEDHPDYYGRLSSYLDSATHNSGLDYSCQPTSLVSYRTLIEAWQNTQYYTANYSAESLPVILLETEVNGKWGSILMTDKNPGGTVLAKDIMRIRIVKYIPTGTEGQGSSSTTSTNTAFTGSGVLGGSGAGSVSGGALTSIFTGSGFSNSQTTDDSSNTGGNENSNTGNNTENTEPVTLAAYIEDTQETALVWVEVAPTVSAKTDDSAENADSSEAATTADTTYVLLALEGEKTLEDLGGTAAVSMSYTLPMEYAEKPLYVVFRNEDGSLSAIRASYSEITGLLRFFTDRLGEFMVVGFDFDGIEFSEEFYAALTQLKGLENLVYAEYSPV